MPYLFVLDRTLVYELMTERFPFHGEPPETIIWNIGHGHHVRTNEMACPTNIKDIISKCWKPMPHDRPNFITIMKLLLSTVPLHRRHSSSEPEKLNTYGLQISSFGSNQ